MSKSTDLSMYSLFQAITIVMGIVAFLYTLQGFANLAYTDALVTHMGEVIENSVKNVMSSLASTI